jgi:hypothetical protein
MRFAKQLGFCAIALGVLAAQPALADTPSSVMYEGTLYTGGTPVEGTFEVRFSLYSSAVGGARLAALDVPEVTVTSGAFAVDVGTLFQSADGNMFLEVAIKGASDNDFDIMPRVPVTSVPFALRAHVADGVDWKNVKNAPAVLTGKQGPAGPTGSPGAPGAQGPAGPAGAAGVNGLPGDPGPMGPGGAPGPAGPAGTSVVALSIAPQPDTCPFGGVQLNVGPLASFVCNGKDGASGQAGTTASIEDVDVGDPKCPAGGLRVTVGQESSYACNGANGLPGAPGVPGPPGVPGAPGAIGPAGQNGAMGPAGPAGPPGAVGSTGSPGESGPMGPQGLMGPQGMMGLPGLPGSVGPQGLMGPQGMMGTPGAMGPAGPPGAMGPAGPQGGMGPSGAPGDSGPMGPPGIMGMQGFMGPQGMMGPQGAMGLPGPQGIPGMPGWPGPTGDVGPMGPAGDSVVAQSIGPDPEACPAGGVQFTIGTQTSLVCNGKDGTSGGSGGATGPAGQDGAVGPMGPSGPQGPMGPSGIPGGMGPMGPQGADGAVGPQGAAGQMGPAGSVGAQGPGGPQGAQGAQGAAGAAGPQGADGAGVPTGGTAGQVLSKIDGTSYNTQWVTPASGAAMTVKDSASPAHTLGRVLTINDTSVLFLTSTGYRASVQYDGTGLGRQAYFGNQTCSGTPYVNSGSSTASAFLWGQVAYYYSGFGWAVPKASTLDANGRASSQSPGTFGQTFTSIYNISGTACSLAGVPGGAPVVANYTWEMQSVSAAALGLPATVTPPLVVQ